MKADPLTIGCIVAHPDDETLGAGGTLAKLAGMGHEVRVFILADGVSSRYTVNVDDADDVFSVRLAMCQSACRVLGVSSMHLAEPLFPDNAMDTVSRLAVAQRIEQYLASRTTFPDVIYTHHPGDLNVDHRRVAEAVVTATRPGGKYPVPSLYAMEVASSTEWAFGAVGPHFTPNTFSSIQDTLDRKLAAMACYDTEQPQSPHPRSREMLMTRAQYWGSVAGCPAAEAFQLIRSLQ